MRNVEQKRCVAIVCAVGPELRAVAARLRRAKKSGMGLFSSYTGELGGAECRLILSGVGVTAAYAATKQVCHQFSLQLVVSFGVAGALDPALEIADVVIGHTAAHLQLSAEEVVRVRMTTEGEGAQISTLPAAALAEKVTADPKLPERLASQFELKVARALSTNFAVDSDRMRDLLWRTYGLPIVDQESYGVLKAAKEEGVAGLIVRVIADRAGDMAESECHEHARRVLLTGAEILEPIIHRIIEL